MRLPSYISRYKLQIHHKKNRIKMKKFLFVAVIAAAFASCNDTSAEQKTADSLAAVKTADSLQAIKTADSLKALPADTATKMAPMSSDTASKMAPDSTK